MALRQIEMARGKRKGERSIKDNSDELRLELGGIENGVLLFQVRRMRRCSDSEGQIVTKGACSLPFAHSISFILSLCEHWLTFMPIPFPQPRKAFAWPGETNVNHALISSIIGES